MAGDVGSFGYRTKAQREAEFKLITSGLSATERNTCLKFIRRVMADLQDCCSVREQMVSKISDASAVSRRAVQARKDKSTKERRDGAQKGMVYARASDRACA